MRITKRQLRKLIRESCGLERDEEELPAEESLPGVTQGALPTLEPALEPALEIPEAPAAEAASVPVPEDYQAVRGFLDMNPELTDVAIQQVMDVVGTSCERSTAQAIVDHLQELLGTAAEMEELDPLVFDGGALAL